MTIKIFFILHKALFVLILKLIMKILNVYNNDILVTLYNKVSLLTFINALTNTNLQ